MINLSAEGFDSLQGDNSEQEFKKLYLGDFKVSDREIDLRERLELYYRQTPYEMDNRTAMGYWKEFNRWCVERGYTQKEINQAKRNLCRLKAPKK
tara:strand:+ start:8760 stop:9044 length:285 start_codon:yes stop_codon:yes gene_type:complete